VRVAGVDDIRNAPPRRRTPEYSSAELEGKSNFSEQSITFKNHLCCIRNANRLASPDAFNGVRRYPRDCCCPRNRALACTNSVTTAIFGTWPSSECLSMVALPFYGNFRQCRNTRRKPSSSRSLLQEDERAAQVRNASPLRALVCHATPPPDCTPSHHLFSDTWFRCGLSLPSLDDVPAMRDIAAAPMDNFLIKAGFPSHIVPTLVISPRAAPSTTCSTRLHPNPAPAHVFFSISI